MCALQESSPGGIYLAGTDRTLAIYSCSSTLYLLLAVVVLHYIGHPTAHHYLDNSFSNQTSTIIHCCTRSPRSHLLALFLYVTRLHERFSLIQSNDFGLMLEASEQSEPSSFFFPCRSDQIQRWHCNAYASFVHSKRFFCSIFVSISTR